MDEKLEREFEILRSFAKALAMNANEVPEQIKHTLTSDRPLPEGCPSKGSLALMELRQLQKNLEEVEAAHVRIYQHIVGNYCN